MHTDEVSWVGQLYQRVLSNEPKVFCTGVDSMVERILMLIMASYALVRLDHLTMISVVSD